MEEREAGNAGAKVSNREVFSLCGPLHLTSIDWKNPHHRRSVAASLVRGVCIIEHDRQFNRQGYHAQASPWWNFFNFELIRPLVDDVDFSIFGAIYKYKPYGLDYDAPKYVIAFRGTLNKPYSRSRDLKLDLQCIFNRLHLSSRFQLGMEAVQSIVSLVGVSHIWLAGHSLGSAIALLIGRNMKKMGFPIESYLFNPPFISLPIDTMKNQKAKDGIRIASSVIKAGFAAALKSKNRESQEDDSFCLLSEWFPYLFVNPSDYICSGYIAYFEHRKKMTKLGGRKIERLASKHSIISLVSGLLGKNSEPLHLLPSAYLTVNLRQSPDFKRAHGLHQWWDLNFHGQTELHVFS